MRPGLSVFLRPHAQSGVAAIEMAFVMPVLLILLFGLIDLTGILSVKRKASYAGQVVADLVTRLDSPTTKALVEDTLNAADIIMAPQASTEFRVEIHNIRGTTASGGTTAAPEWSVAYGGAAGYDCVDPDPSALTSLVTSGNDVIVVVTCTTVDTLLANIVRPRILGGTRFTFREQIAMRPRQSAQLECTGKCL